jgi:hypothetical protein
MSKPPMGAELLTKTPTVKLDPTVTGPIVGALPGQFVAVEDAVIQTTPVPV